MRHVLLLVLGAVSAARCDAQGPPSPPSRPSTAAPRGVVVGTVGGGPTSGGFELRGDTAVVWTHATTALKYVRRGDTVIVRREEHGQFLREHRWLILGDSAILMTGPARGHMVLPTSSLLSPWEFAKSTRAVDAVLQRRGPSP
jgi:hypothetical protein